MILDVLFAGLKALEQYLVLNFLTTLVPAFFLAGAIVTFVSRDAIVGYLGSRAKKGSSFSIAAGSGFFLQSAP